MAVDTWDTDNHHVSTIHRIVDRPNYALDIEETPIGSLNVLTIHFEVYSWTPSVMREMLRDWPGVRAQINAPLLAYVEHNDPKWAKFVSRFGFVFLCHAQDYDGRFVDIFANY